MDGGESIVSVKVNPWLAWYGVGVSALVICPFVMSTYGIMVLTSSLLYGMAALGLDVIWGKGGLVSFGHSVFFGIGAYVTAIVALRFGASAALGDYVGILAGIAASGLVGALIAYFLLFGGVRGPYVAIVTLTLAVIANRLIIGWPSVTGGNTGLLGVAPMRLDLLGYRLTLMGVPLYWTVALIISVLVIAVWLADRGRFGQVLAAIRSRESRALSLGYNTSLYLWGAFLVGSMIAGLAGSLYATESGAVTPDLVGLTLATDMLAWVAVGGRGTLIGPIVATVLVLALKSTLSSLSPGLWPVILGVFFVTMVFTSRDTLRAMAHKSLQSVSGSRGD